MGASLDAKLNWKNRALYHSYAALGKLKLTGPLGRFKGRDAT